MIAGWIAVLFAIIDFHCWRPQHSIPLSLERPFCLIGDRPHVWLVDDLKVILNDTNSIIINMEIDDLTGIIFDLPLIMWKY